MLPEASKNVYKRTNDVFPGIERPVTVHDAIESDKGKSAPPRIVLGNDCPGVQPWLTCMKKDDNPVVKPLFQVFSK